MTYKREFEDITNKADVKETPERLSEDSGVNESENDEKSDIKSDTKKNAAGAPLKDDALTSVEVMDAVQKEEHREGNEEGSRVSGSSVYRGNLTKLQSVVLGAN